MSISQNLLDYYRCPKELAIFQTPTNLVLNAGFFGFGDGQVCYGRSTAEVRLQSSPEGLHDASQNLKLTENRCYLPFPPDDIIDNLRYEKYISAGGNGRSNQSLIRKGYYFLRPLLGVGVRKHLQRYHLRNWNEAAFPVWPVDFSADTLLERLLGLAMQAQGIERVPFIWFWPNGHSGSVAMTHDIETVGGRDFCSALMDINDSFGIKSSFQVVPEKRYKVPEAFLDSIRSRGFEVNVHDLNHDGRLYEDHEEFLRRAGRINHYAEQYKAQGFRSGALYRKLGWYDAFTFSYDMSVPNVAHLDPQKGGCCTVMPYFVGNVLEIPVTAIQDYSLFHFLDDYSIELWRKQIELILSHHGVASFIVHPDYVRERRAQQVYRDLLSHISRLGEQHKVWIALPGDINRWWRERSRMTLIQEDGNCRIAGPGSERARVAYASLVNGELLYELAGSS